VCSGLILFSEIYGPKWIYKISYFVNLISVGLYSHRISYLPGRGSGGGSLRTRRTRTRERSSSRRTRRRRRRGGGGGGGRTRTRTRRKVEEEADCVLIIYGSYSLMLQHDSRTDTLNHLPPLVV
jgi:hypothetical protein